MTAMKIPALTGREQGVLGLMAEGMTNAGIGQVMYLSANTVKLNVASLYRKLGAKDRASAVYLGVRAGVLLPDVRRALVVAHATLSERTVCRVDEPAVVRARTVVFEALSLTGGVR